MTTLLIRLFIMNYTDVGNPDVRRRYGYLAGSVGLLANLGLFSGKLFLGIASHSIAIMADAINNLTDCTSSVLTLVGFWTSGKPADREHPFGHGRSEYIAALVVSALVMMVGVQFAGSAVGRILNPVPLEYDMYTVGALIAAVVVKGWLALFYREMGRKTESKVMLATAADSLGDVATTAIVILGLMAGPFIPFAIDGYLGLVVSLLIIWNGWNLVMDTLSPLLGEAPDADFIKALEGCLNAYEGFLGFHDMVVHNYGHGKAVVSIHAEVPVSLGMIGAHELIDTVEKEVSRTMGVDLVVHMDPVDCENEEAVRVKAMVEAALNRIEGLLSIHDFRIVYLEEGKVVHFDLILPHQRVREEENMVSTLRADLEKLLGDYSLEIHVEHEFSMLHASRLT